MERIPKRTIEEVLNYETGEQINAYEFFKKPIDELHLYRSELQKAIQGIRDTLFTCYYCKQKVRIRGGISLPYKRKADIFHFAHLKDSDECHIKTKNKYTKDEVDRIKYNGAKESILHQTLKEYIAECLRRNQNTKKEVSSVEVEKVIRDTVAKEWKTPDINAYFNDKRIAIELQLSTTWLDVITKRQHFYKEQGIYIFWVFHAFNSNDDTRKLTYNDVIYTNNQNAYIFDEEAYILSKKENDLILKCWYKMYSSEGKNIDEDWEYSFIKLSDLTFDEENIRIYYHDTETQKKAVEQEIENYNRELRESGRLKILEQQERNRKKQEIENNIEDLSNDIKDKILTKYEIEQKELTTKTKLSELKDFELKVNEYADKIVKYIADKRSFSKPFYEHDDLLRSLKEEFSDQIKSVSDIIAGKKLEENKFNNIIKTINEFLKIAVAGKVYSSLDNNRDWDLIKNRYKEILTINKNSVNGLFAASELKPILNEFSLNRFKFSKDILFLIDFDSIVNDANEENKKIQEIIGQQENIITIITKKIKSKLKRHIHKEINVAESKHQNYLVKQTKLNNELDRMEHTLADFELALDQLE